MSFVPYAGTQDDWAAERDALLTMHKREEVGFVHDNLNPNDCSCRYASVVSMPTRTADFDGRTCAGCGGSSFITTGTCHTCATCGTSDGCG